MDVETTFSNDELDEEIYRKQPEGFVMSRNENKVCKLKKLLYDLKQAPTQWHKKLDDRGSKEQSPWLGSSYRANLEKFYLG